MDLNINWKDSKSVECSNCGHKFFEELFIVRRFESEQFISNGKTIPIAVLSCTNCQTIQKQLLPKQIQEIL